jgi:3,4-dehydroadipyl-CoA semialdehyde dehydrogenase
MSVLTSFVQGRWVEHDGAAGTPLVDPLTGTVAAVVSGAPVDRRAALAWARGRGGGLRGLTFAQRGQRLRAWSRSIHALRDELLELSRASYGATRSDAKFDVDGASGTLAWYAGLGERLGDRRWLLDGDAEVLGRSPRLVGQHVLVSRLGVAVHINAFNFPAWGMCEKLAVSVLAGVPALVKPAVATCPVAWRIVQAWHEQGLLDGEVSLLLGPAGDLLEHLEAVDVVAFTGSSETARRIRGHARVVELGVPVNVEADSLNASVLGPDAEPGEVTFELCVSEAARDVVQKAGQKCTAIRRLLVPRERVAQVQEALADRLADVRPGELDGRDALAPVSTVDQHRDVERGIAALGQHARLVVQGPGGEGCVVAPRVFLAEGGVDAGYVHDHEVFGPVVTILPYDGTPAEAVAIVARGGGGLVCSVYSDDVGWAGEVVLGLAPWHGRLWWASAKVADVSPGPGTVLPQLVHGGPGKAGGGEELGGERGMRFYLQRTAIQGDKSLLDRVLGRADG